MDLASVQRQADSLLSITHFGRHHIVPSQSPDRRKNVVTSVSDDLIATRASLAGDVKKGLVTTDTSISSPTDGRPVGCLASHTSGDTMRCSHDRIVDERTHHSASVPDIRLLTTPLVLNVKGSRDDRYIDLEPD